MPISSPAYFLVTHGSRDPRSWSTLQEIVALAQHKEPSLLIGGGCLEGLPLSLGQQLQKFGQAAQALGYEKITIAPLFLIPGVHVSQDIPAEVTIAQQFFPFLRFEIAPYLGTHPEIPKFIQTKFEQNEQNYLSVSQTKPARILMTHGSRQASANQLIESLARFVSAIAAYWSVAPSLETQIEQLRQRGVEQIIVIPYFLAPGGITEAIAAKIQNFQAQTNQVTNIKLGQVPMSFDQIVSLTIF
jgi:sirohydrochlorin cobaltochelatase